MKAGFKSCFYNIKHCIISILLKELKLPLSKAIAVTSIS